MLASNDFVTGKSSLQNYCSNTPKVIDLLISNLPENCDAQMLKKISNSKHVICSTVDEDNFRGVCKGTGRI